MMIEICHHASMKYLHRHTTFMTYSVSLRITSCFIISVTYHGTCTGIYTIFVFSYFSSALSVRDKERLLSKQSFEKLL